MPVFAASFLISLVILGALTFVGLTAGIGIFSDIKRSGGGGGGGGVQFCCLLVALAWAIFCSSYAGMAALAGVVAAGIAMAATLFLKNRI